MKSTVTEIKSSLKCHNSRFKKVEFKKKNSEYDHWSIQIISSKEKKEKRMKNNEWSQ